MPGLPTRRRTLRILGSAATVGLAGCVDREPTPWFGVGAAVVESPPDGTSTIPASEERLTELDHVQRAIDEALNEGHTQVETTEAAYSETDNVFRDLPHLLVVGNATLGDSPEFVTPEDSILPDFMREHELLPVIFTRFDEPIVSVWPLHYELV